MQQRCIQYITKENLLLREDLLGHFFLIGLGGGRLCGFPIMYFLQRG